ncbi:hypothetical protein J6590_022785 [Homalodisca vitripennis]|nr:hypothetical protein J6590_022785 [Homalodisca vitripennis]
MTTYLSPNSVCKFSNLLIHPDSRRKRCSDEKQCRRVSSKRKLDSGVYAFLRIPYWIHPLKLLWGARALIAGPDSPALAPRRRNSSLSLSQVNVKGCTRRTKRGKFHLTKTLRSYFLCFLSLMSPVLFPARFNSKLSSCISAYRI